MKNTQVHNYCLLKTKREIKRIGSNVFHEKELPRYIQISCIGRNKSYFATKKPHSNNTKKDPNSNKKFSEADIIAMLEFIFIDNICDVLGSCGVFFNR